MGVGESESESGRDEVKLKSSDPERVGSGSDRIERRRMGWDMG